MSEFNGTKEKWKLEIGETRCWLNDGNKKSIGILFGKDYNVPTNEMKANAKLIACAPELLEMLKELLLDIDEITIPTSMNNTIFKAEQIIQKATL